MVNFSLFLLHPPPPFSYFHHESSLCRMQSRMHNLFDFMCTVFILCIYLFPWHVCLRLPRCKNSRQTSLPLDSILETIWKCLVSSLFWRVTELKHHFVCERANERMCACAVIVFNIFVLYIKKRRALLTHRFLHSKILFPFCFYVFFLCTFFSLVRLAHIFFHVVFALIVYLFIIKWCIFFLHRPCDICFFSPVLFSFSSQFRRILRIE